MHHISKHILELYVLNSKKIKDQRTEIESHLGECEGCTALVENMRAFYQEVAQEYEQNTDISPKPQKALMRVENGITSFNESFGVPASYQPRTLVGKFRYFVMKRPIVATVGSFGMAAVCVMIGMLISNPLKREETRIPKDSNPAFTNYNQSTDMLEVLNAEHQLLWQLKSPNIGVAGKEEEHSNTNRTVIADLDGDGKNELITCLNVLGYETRGEDRHLLVFNSDSKLLLNKKIVESVNYLDREYSPYFNIGGVAVWRDTKNENNIFVITNNGRSPAFLQRLTGKAEVIGTYWHFGFIGGFGKRDLDGDGHQELILYGKNDADDTTNTEFAFVAVLDPGKIIGERRSVSSPGYHLPPSDAELYYVKFPRVDLDSVSHTSSGIKRMAETDSTTVRFEMSHSDGWDFDFFFDHTMHVLQVKSYDNTDAFHKKLEEEGKLSGTIDKAYMENLKNGVRYWDGKEWRKEVVKVQHSANLP